MNLLVVEFRRLCNATIKTKYMEALFFFQVQDQMFGYKNIFATFLPFRAVDLHVDMEHQT